MTGPAVSALRFLAGILLGAGLGLFYGALRPLRLRHPHWADALFVPLMGYVWLYHSFAVCRGDIRLGYTAGLFIGCFLWEQTAGRWLRPLFFAFWGAVETFFTFFFRRVRKFFAFFIHFAKKLFASAKKWVTIEWNIRCPKAAETGGNPHGKRVLHPRSGQSGIPQKR